MSRDGLGSCLFLLGILLGIAASACHAEDVWDDALCPDGGTSLTYENFGKSLVYSECQSCHATGAADRRGAPSHVTFDDLEEVREWAPRIYERSAFGNASMPPGPVDLDEEVRADLGEWLACGAPSDQDGERESEKSE